MLFSNNVLILQQYAIVCSSNALVSVMPMLSARVSFRMFIFLLTSFDT